MSDEIEFNGVRASAPLFRSVPPETLTQIVECWSSASYHYADDSGGEWGSASKKMNEAAALIVDNQLEYAAIVRLHAHKPQLVSLDAVMRSVFKNLYAQSELLAIARKNETKGD